jgi:hypothetical protein
MVGVAARGELTKRQRVVSRALNLAAGKTAGGIAVDQQAEQDLGVTGGAAASRASLWLAWRMKRAR